MEGKTNRGKAAVGISSSTSSEWRAEVQADVEG